MGRRVLRRHIRGYSVCLCPTKMTLGLYELKTPIYVLQKDDILSVFIFCFHADIFIIYRIQTLLHVYAEYTRQTSKKSLVNN